MTKDQTKQVTETKNIKTLPVVQNRVALSKDPSREALTPECTSLWAKFCARW